MEMYISKKVYSIIGVLHKTVQHFTALLRTVQHCTNLIIVIHRYTTHLNAHRNTTVYKTKRGCTKVYFPSLPLAAAHNDPETIKRIHLQWLQGKQGLQTVHRAL